MSIVRCIQCSRVTRLCRVTHNADGQLGSSFFVCLSFFAYESEVMLSHLTMGHPLERLLAWMVPILVCVFVMHAEIFLNLFWREGNNLLRFHGPMVRSFCVDANANNQQWSHQQVSGQAWEHGSMGKVWATTKTGALCKPVRRTIWLGCCTYFIQSLLC